MSYFIELAHANEALAGKWKVVDRVEHAGSVEDALVSPSFDHERTNLVRARSDKHLVYFGVFGDDGWISLRNDNEIIFKPEDYRFISSADNFLDRWRRFRDPFYATRGLQDLLDEKTLSRLLFKLCQKYLSGFVQEHDLARTAVTLVKGYLSGKLDSTEFRESVSEMYDFDNDPPFAFIFMIAMVRCTYQKQAFCEAMENLELAIAERNQINSTNSGIWLSDSMRIFLPLYDIMLAVTK